MSSFIQTYLAIIVSQVPQLLVLAAGLVIGLLNRGRHPTPSLFVLISCSILLLVALLQPALTHFMVQSGEYSSGSRAMFFGVSGFLFGIIRAGALALLIAAAFSRREPVAAAPSPPAFPG